ncbi:MAG: hypothetical protein QGH51_02515 [Planctomycetota bacterium]|jgi:hypothetical protein|nr:hypothetical protein [Planctomycetota bacterium]MDP6940876.1 hypothetical protein [Planctomycetota bacterium]
MENNKEEDFEKAINILDKAMHVELKISRSRKWKWIGLSLVLLSGVCVLGMFFEIGLFSDEIWEWIIYLTFWSGTCSGIDGYSGEREGHLIRYARDLEDRLSEQQ